MRINFYKFFSPFILLLMIVSLNAYSQEYINGMQKGVVRIKLNPDLVESPTGLAIYSKKGVAMSGVSQIDALNVENNAFEMKRVFRYSPKNEEKHRKHGLHLWYQIEFNSDKELESIISQYGSVAGIDIAEPVLERRLITGTFEEYKYSPEAAAMATSSFNDPYLKDQWHYNNTGQSGGTAGADINLFEAWQINSGSNNVIISIHDEGIDYSHEDLQNSMWINEAELNGVEGVDDDGNGYRDDIYGYNFKNNTGTITKMSHGTHVAGTIGAENNNGIGVSGVSGGSGQNDGVRIMSAQIMDDNGGGAYTPESYTYAADNGAVISQNSWGYTTPGFTEQVVHDAIDYFIAEAQSDLMQGGVVIFAAGNSYAEGNYYPAAYEPVIAVSALNHNNVKSDYSNWGTMIDIAAPGGDDYASILSTLPNDRYGYSMGTSMACPHVSGIAGLALAENGGPGFTNENLKAHILTAGVVVDTMAANQPWAGKMGDAIDAALAVANDNEIAPAAISDLTLVGIAQDFADLSWTVTNDDDDVVPNKFIIYWSTSEITATTIQLAKSTELSGRYQVGESQQITISGLSSLTTYNFAVVGVDRWGNVSDLSNIVTGETNEGPDPSLVETGITIDIDVSVDPFGTDTFRIANNGAGYLQWEANARHSSNYDAYSVDFKYPELKSTASKEMEVSSLLVERPEKIAPYEQVYNPIYYQYYDNWMDLYLLGEMDLELPNSMATRYEVTDDIGFNLDQVTVFMQHDNATGPIIFEVYQGANLNQAKLVARQNVTSYKTEPYYRYVYLDEQLYFEKGDYFWIVFHVPAGTEYPLGAGYELSEELSNNCFMSNNYGESWSRLEDVYYDNRLVWAVDVTSSYESLGDYILINPERGNVTTDDTVKVATDVNAENLIEGSYYANVVVSTNSTETPLLKMPVTINVTGQEPNLIAPELVDFGGVMYGTEKELEIIFKNTGLDKFRNPTVTFSNPDFYTEGYLYSIGAQYESSLIVKYKPGAPGNSNGILTITSSEGQEVQILLVGVAGEPPVANFDPADTTLAGNNIGDTPAGLWRVSNTGNYPLDYMLPAFLTEDVVLEDEFLTKYGYSWDSLTYVWNDISATGIRVTDNFKGYRANYYKVGIGFNFPFFGEKFDSLYITKYGMLTFDDNSTFNYRPMRIKSKNLYNPNQYISAIGAELKPVNGGDIYYQRYPDRVVVQYQDVPYEQSGNFYNYTFQIIIYENGDIAYQFNSFGGLNPYYLGSLLVAIEDQPKNDALLINQSGTNIAVPADGLGFYITSPGRGIIKNVDKPEGTLLPGETVVINYDVETTELSQGTFTERVTMVSNDPFNSQLVGNVNVEIIGGGISDVTVGEDTLDFGQVFQNGAKQLDFMVKNNGTKDVNITTLTFKYGNDSIFAGNVPEILKAGHTLYYTVAINSSALGVMNDTITITTDEGQSFIITLLGEIIDAPGISVDITQIDEVLNSGDSTLVNMTVTNTGGNPLEVAVEGNDWLAPLTAEMPLNYGYAVKNSMVDEEASFNWINIIAPENQDTLDPFAPGGYAEPIALPFEFEFYGNKYDTVYFGFNGLAYFDPFENTGDLFWGGTSIPSTESINNFIAPMWAFMSVGNSPVSGTYHKVFADKVVMVWEGYIDNFFMGDLCSFQLILYNTGEIKFQYILGNFESITNLGSIGVENEDGTDGVQISFNETFVQNGQALVLTPVNTVAIPAGNSLDYGIVLDAKDLLGGTYTGGLDLNTNVPGTELVTIPATLQVNGEPVYEGPSIIDFGKVVGGNGETYEQEFTFGNSGTAALTLESIVHTSTSTETDVLRQYIDNGWWGPTIYWLAPDYAGIFFYPESMNPGTTVTLKAVLTPSATIPQISDTLVLTFTELGEVKIPIEAETFMPPVINLDTNMVSVIANNAQHTETKSVVIDNNDGYSMLTYSLEMVYEREQSAASVAKFVPAATSAVVNTELQSVKAENEVVKSQIQPLSVPGYNRTLEHDTSDVPEQMIGYGGTTSLYAATKFVAPADGFNLTHVMSFWRPEEWLSSRITVSILGGADNIFEAQELYSQVYEYNTDTANNDGFYANIELENNITFYPNEEFYVVFKYPYPIMYPQGVAIIDPSKPETFYYGDGTGWSDLNGYNANYGWMMKALEFEAGAGVWVTLNSAADGTIDVGNNVQVDLDFNAHYATEGLNTAELIIRSDDPVNPEIKVDVSLLLNNAPKFEDAPELSFSLKENETITYVVKASDAELDDFIYSLESTVNYLTATDVTGGYELTFAPDYDAERTYMFNVLATDTNNNVGALPVTINVEQVNRAPQVVSTIEDIRLYTTVGMEQQPVDIYFTDPDGDELTFISEISEELIARVYGKDESVIVLEPLALGNTSLKVLARDLGGDTVSVVVPVTVQDVSGINNINNDVISIYPNPTADDLHVNLGNVKETVSSVRIVNASGKVIEEYNYINNQMSFDVSHLAEGVYHIEIVTENNKLSEIFIKM